MNSFVIDHSVLNSVRQSAANFLCAVCPDDISATLTRSAEAGSFALCFRVFLAHLLGRHDLLNKRDISVALRDNVRSLRRSYGGVPPTNKAFRQLLAFSLSALSVLGMLEEDPLEELVLEQLPGSIAHQLQNLGCLSGQAGAGNQAMFIAIFLLHAHRYLGRNVANDIRQWVSLHLEHMNERGFWSGHRGMTHLEFQNGYHQYEILEFLGVHLPDLPGSAGQVLQLADNEGHFAPYPGGGGCYDYDATFVLTMMGDKRTPEIEQGLLKLASSIMGEQNSDGGYCESHWIRPRGMRTWWRFLRHIIGSPNRNVLVERIRYALALQLPKHDRIQTHWSQYSRRWNESDLWDTWFRLMALARIDVMLAPERASSWGFISYPGIGFHPSVGDPEWRLDL